MENKEKIHFKDGDLYQVSKMLSDFEINLGEIHDINCNYIRVISAPEGSDLEHADGDCDCGLQKVEEALGKLYDAIEDSYNSKEDLDISDTMRGGPSADTN